MIRAFHVSSTCTSWVCLTDTSLWLHWNFSPKSYSAFCCCLWLGDGWPFPSSWLLSDTARSSSQTLILRHIVGWEWGKGLNCLLGLKLRLNMRGLPAPRQEEDGIRGKSFCPMRSGQGRWQLLFVLLWQASGSWQLGVLKLRWGCWDGFSSGPYIMSLVLLKEAE